MNLGMISVRYAKALLAFANEQKATRQVFEHLSALSDAFVQHPTLAVVLKNPTLATDKKRALILTASAANESPIVAKFVDLILENHREELLQRIALVYCDLFQSDSKICVGHVSTAATLDSKTEAKIGEMLAKWSGRKVEITTKIKPELLGGFVVDVDGQRLDASIAGQLSKIRKELAK